MKFAIYMTSERAVKTAGAAVIPKRRNSSGFTLIELLVYMAIMGFVIVVAGRVFSDSTSMRVRSQSMIASAEEGGRVTALLKEDISQMGTKSFGAPDANVNSHVFDSVAAVHIKFEGNDADLSSYILTKGTAFDRLVFHKLNYGTDGICNALLKVTWFVENNALKRNCEVIPSKCPAPATGAEDFYASICPASLEMVSGITEFKFLPSKPGNPGSSVSSDLMFPPPGSSGAFGLRVANNSSALTANVSIKIFENTAVPSHYSFVSGNVGCHEFEFLGGEEYAVEFDLPHKVNPDDPCIIVGSTDCGGEGRHNPMSMFQIGYDHLSLGLRNSASGNPITNTVPDFLFYPPQDNNASSIRRHFRFSVPTTLKACVGITVALYSEARKGGHLDFENFRVFRITDKVYYFDREDPNYNPTATSTPNKASVKAFELTLGVKRKSEINKTVMVIPVPNNGIAGGF